MWTKAVVIGASLFILAPIAKATDKAQANDFWSSRDVTIAATLPVPPVRIGVWDSGVDLALFEGQISRDANGRPLVRGYSPFKIRQDTPLAILPVELLARRDDMNDSLRGFDDLDSGVKSEAAAKIEARLGSMSKNVKAAFLEDVGRWTGYAHGTNVADIALRGHAKAEIVVARMEWWHGNPPVPCWTRELADREAQSIGDLLEFLVRSGARVVNMSWGRFESSYIRNLEQCAPAMPDSERKALARYTVEKIRGVLQSGMSKAPDVLFVGAAGNAGASLQSENPATRFAAPNLVLVGAVDASGALASYSNKGSEVSLYANGYRIPARLPGGMESFPTGTSMATPNVANAAAKVLAVNPSLTGAKLKDLLLATSDTNATGQRLLHTRRAVEAARSLMMADAGNIAPR